MFAPWILPFAGALSLASAAAARAPQAGLGGYTVSEGFAVERASELARSFLALAFDPAGRLFLSVENGPIVRLVDADHDGSFESESTLAPDLESAQGLAWRGDELWAVGRRGGEDGLFRIRTDAAHERQLSVELVLAIVGANGSDPPGEHGAHGVVVGPDGALYLAMGNHGRFALPPEAGSPLVRGYEGTLLPRYDDPLGHAVHVRYPCGYVARIDPERASWRYVCVGLRNAYDLAFDARGELFTFDSDMEWDVGLPWYRPTRFLHVVDGADFGSRAGSSPWPDWYDDSLPSVADDGRGSPTGVVVYESDRWPARLRGAVIAGDWARGRIVALHPERSGGSFTGRIETLLEAAQGLNVTDLDVGPDGALYFAAGGRGVIGHIERLVWRGARDADAPTPRDASVRAIRELDRARSAAERGAAATDAALEQALGATDADVRARAAFWLGRELERAASPLALERASRAARDPEPAVRAEALRALALARAADSRGKDAILAALADRDRHVRYAARFAWERAVGPAASGAPNVDPILWARRWLEERRTPLDPSAASSGEPRTYYLPFRAPADGEAWLACLRSIEIALEELGANARLQGQGVDWDAALLAAFPHPDARVSRLAASVLAARDVAGAREKLLAALAAEPIREQAIHYARCLVECRREWPHADVRALLAWFDQAESWTGVGASFPGYLHALRERFTSRFDDAAKVALAREAPMGGRTLAEFARSVAEDRVDDLLAPLQYAWVEVAARRDEAGARLERGAILRALGAARSAGLAAWLRKLSDEPSAPRDEVLRALAEQRAADDAPILIEGLASESFTTVEACIAALASFERGPTDSRGPLAALLAARRLGSSRGVKALELAARWLELPADDEAHGDWTLQLSRVEREFRTRFPDVPLSGASDDTAPRWETEALIGFLERSASRPGSTVRGKRIFERASCFTCHVVAGATFSAPSAGVGPELGDVGKRFDTRALVEAVLTPSRAIGDLYRTTVVITRDEERLEGRIVRDDERGLELLQADGVRVEVARDEIDEQRPSEVSLMPEGLLLPFDWEDAKDLFSFLAAGRELPGDDARPLEPLFAGKARNLWNGDRSVWKLDGELLIGTGAKLERNQYLTSKLAWSDFELAFDVRLSAGANSGVQLRSRVVPDAADPLGVQLDLGQAVWGSLYDTSQGTLIAAADPRWRAAVAPTGWNHVFVRCAGRRITCELDGLTTVDVERPESESGVLAFQLHRGLEMEVRVTHARLLDLTAR